MSLIWLGRSRSLIFFVESDCGVLGGRRVQRLREEILGFIGSQEEIWGEQIWGELVRVRYFLKKKNLNDFRMGNRLVKEEFGYRQKFFGRDWIFRDQSEQDIGFGFVSGRGLGVVDMDCFRGGIGVKIYMWWGEGKGRGGYMQKNIKFFIRVL